MFLLVRWANWNKYLTRILGSSSVYALLNVSSQIPRYRIQGSRLIYALLKVSSQIPRYMIQITGYKVQDQNMLYSRSHPRYLDTWYKVQDQYMLLLKVSSQIPRYRIQDSRSVYALLKVSSQIPRYRIQITRYKVQDQYMLYSRSHLRCLDTGYR